MSLSMRMLPNIANMLKDKDYSKKKTRSDSGREVFNKNDEYIEIKCQLVDDAITEALLKLGTTSDKIEYEVIEKGSAGFLGFIGKTQAVIRVRKNLI